MAIKSKALNFINPIIYWFIVILPFSIAIAPAFTNFIWAVLCVFYLLKKFISRENPVVRTQINVVFMLFMAISAISLINTTNYTSSLRGLFKLVQYGLLLLAMASEIKDKKHIERIILFMILGGLFSSIDGFWQLIYGKDFIRGNSLIVNLGLKRITAAFPNANVLGVYLTPIFALAFGLARYHFKNRAATYFFAASIAILLGVLFTYSRIALLACYLGLFFLAIIKKDKILLAALVVLIVIFPFCLPKSVKEWAKESNYNPIVFLLNTDRISLYENSLNMIKDHPLVGVGVNTFSENYHKYKSAESMMLTGETMYAHNNFLQIAGEVGLLGLAAFIWLLIKILKCSYRNYVRFKDKYCSILSLSITSSLIVFLANGMAETSLYYKRVSVIFYFLVGVILALNNLKNEADKES